MKKYRILKREYADSSIDYVIQYRCMFFFWLELEYNQYYRIVDNLYAWAFDDGSVVKSNSFIDVFNIVLWISLNENCFVGKDMDNEILYLYCKKNQDILGFKDLNEAIEAYKHIQLQSKCLKETKIYI